MSANDSGRPLGHNAVAAIVRGVLEANGEDPMHWDARIYRFADQWGKLYDPERVREYWSLVVAGVGRDAP